MKIIRTITKTLLTTCFALAAVAPARADLVMVQEMSGSASMNGNITTTFKDDLARVDVGSQMSTIVDGKSGKITNLMHDQKMVMTMDGGQIQAIQEQFLKVLQEDDQSSSAPAEIKSTGKKETINGFQAEEYLLEQNGGTTRMWLAKDFPNKDSILKRMANFQNSDALKFAAAAKGYDVAKLPGFPVRIVSNTQGVETTITLVSIEEKDVDPALFEIPAGYNALQVPSIGDILKNLPSGE